MAMLRSLAILFLLILPAISGANARFNEYCEELPRSGEKFQWLKTVFETEDCSEIASGISRLKSFDEFLPPLISMRSSVMDQWLSHEKNTLFYKEGVPSLESNQKFLNLFRDLSPFRDFENLTHVNTAGSAMVQKLFIEPPQFDEERLSNEQCRKNPSIWGGNETEPGTGPSREAKSSRNP